MRKLNGVRCYSDTRDYSMYCTISKSWSKIFKPWLVEFALCSPSVTSTILDSFHIVSIEGLDESAALACPHRPAHSQLALLLQSLAILLIRKFYFQIQIKSKQFLSKTIHCHVMKKRERLFNGRGPPWSLPVVVAAMFGSAWRRVPYVCLLSLS